MEQKQSRASRAESPFRQAAAGELNEQAVSEAPASRAAPERPAPRAEDPRARAARRAAEIRDAGGVLEDGVDEFYIPPHLVPDGWDYQWKRKSIFNQEDPTHMQALLQRGWEPVPASRHPEMMPGIAGATTIERKGMILMERPIEISQEARIQSLRRARQQVRVKEEQLTAAPPGQFARANKDAPLAKVKKNFEAMQIPDEM